MFDVGDQVAQDLVGALQKGSTSAAGAGVGYGGQRQTGFRGMKHT